LRVEPGFSEYRPTRSSRPRRRDVRHAELHRLSSNRLLASILPKTATLDAGVADLSFVKDTVEERAGRRPSDDREGNRLGAGVHRLCIAAVDRIAG
jgi:hypothetical protein